MKGHTLTQSKYHTLLILLIIAAIGTFVSGCSSLTGKSLEHRARYPLKTCDNPGESKCVSPLFTKEANIAKRDPKNFPAHYLELYDEALRTEDCKQMGTPGKRCENRLKMVAHFFNNKDKRPEENKIGLALEGGGTKAGSFSMGALAGLQELGLLDTQVGAISSISGGSYAASYYFNRWYDRLKFNNNSSSDEWFRSCIPEYFLQTGHFDLLFNQVNQVSCREKSEGLSDVGYNEFGNKYEYIGHVWKNHDLLRGDTSGRLRTPKEIGFWEVSNLALMVGQTAITAPFNFLTRTVFRWPLNSAPSKLTYKLGLEREYGYSPKDWAAAGSTDLEHLASSLERRKSRTLQNFKQLINDKKEQHIPYWILGTTAPGDIGLDHWINPHPRDPLRQQFELTWDGYGSGTYGYALQPPDAPFDFLGRNPDGLPIVDAVVASAAFFDDDQTQISQQPLRFFAGAGQHLLNITWFTELRNYKQGFDDRLFAKLLPWPSYFGLMTEEGKTPYVHLQDGGNTENSGILPLLRRGYKTIIYAHGTEDRDAEWESICHLKNQLELDGTYSMNSPDLDNLLAAYPIAPASPNGGKFTNHLDELCSSQLDDSDLVTFDENSDQDKTERIPAVARLYCSRLGYPTNYALPCPEFTAKFTAGNSQKVQSNLFFHWRANDSISFKVTRADVKNPKQKVPISTIIAIVPGISVEDMKKQLVSAPQDESIKTWADWCSLDETTRQQRKIAYCYGPEDRLLSTKSNHPKEAALSCSVMAEVLDDDCNDTLGMSLNKPNFPQDSLILQTIHTTYTTYAANFDLARHQVRHAFCNSPDYAYPRPEKCLKAH
jgi:hypothetical protein